MGSDNRYLSEIYSDRGSIFRFFWPLTHYLVTNISVTLGYLYFHLLNKTTVIGKEHVPKAANTLLLSNHQSMIDGFLVGLCAYYPLSLIRPSFIPWNPAAEENFFRNPILAWLADNWKCISVKKGRKDVSAVYKMKLALSSSPLTLFPEGTRSRNSEIGRGRAGSGMVILETWPAVIPVCIDGMDKLLPVGSIFPRLFKRIYVSYGKPVHLTEFKNMERNKETAQAVIDRVMNSIRELQLKIRKMKQ
jgi:1-acyl-sn-glycerol-3-phosphate acyltransferase